MRFNPTYLCWWLCAALHLAPLYLAAQLIPTSRPTPLPCSCLAQSTTLTTSVQGRGRGVPAYIVLRGQRFGGAFGDPIGAGRGFDSGAGGNIPFFPNNVGSTLFGGGVSPRTAREYGTMLGPFKAGVPTIATIIAEIVDEFGTLVSNAPSTTASLVVGNTQHNVALPDDQQRSDALIPNLEVDFVRILGNAYMISSTNGRFEWKNVSLQGLASTTLTLTVRNDIAAHFYSTPNTASTLATCACPIQVSLQGGFPFSMTFATQTVNLDTSLILYPGTRGPFAVPGVIGGTPPQGSVSIRPNGGYDGSVPRIVIGEKVRFPHTGRGTYPATALHVRDRWGNAATFPTTATLALSGGNPPVDPVRTPLIGNVSTSVITWGTGYLGEENLNVSTSASVAQIASNVVIFHELTVLGATSNQCSLVAAMNSCSDPYIPGLNNFNFGCGGSQCPYGRPLNLLSSQKNTTTIHCSQGNTAALVSVMPARAVSIAPVLIPDFYNQNDLNRMPSQMVIGASNNADPRTWFYAQAVDEFDNRVDRGPYEYNGGEGRISFATPEQGFPTSSDGTFQFTPSRDPFTKANTQAYSARGTTASAVRGLYTFKDFVALGPASRTANDVVLTFEDTALKGVRSPVDPFKTRRPFFQPLPPITTATTTFIMRTAVRLSDNAQETMRLVLSPNPIINTHEPVMVSFSVPRHMSVRIEVLSLQGAQMLAVERTVQAGDVSERLGVEGLPSGVYFMRVLSGGQRVGTAMMIVLR